MSLSVHYYTDLRVFDVSSSGLAGLSGLTDQISNSLISTQSASFVTIQSYNSSDIYVAATTPSGNETTLQTSSSYDPNEGIPSATAHSASTTISASAGDGSYDSYQTVSNSQNGAAHVSGSDLKKKVFLMLTISAVAALITI